MLPWRTTTALTLTVATVATAAVAPVVVSGPSPFAGCPSAPSFEGAEVEPMVAAHPRDAKRVVAVYQQDQLPRRRRARHRRRDEHRRRQDVAEGRPAGERMRRRERPAVAVCERPVGQRRPGRRIYASTLSDVVSVTTSTNWGRTWSPPALLRGQYGLTDKETVTADPRRRGWAYVTWSDYLPSSPPATTSDEVVSVTHDGGRSWSAPRVVVRHGQAAGPEDGQIVVDPRNGRLYLFTAWIRDGYATPAQPAWYLVSRSDDGGRHWTAARRFATGAPAERHGGPVIRSSPQVPSFAIDGGGALYAVWQDARLSRGADEDILLTRSTDGGRHWSAPKRVSRLSTAARSSRPSLQRKGSLAILYLALDANADGRYRLARSSDGGRHVADTAASGAFAITDAPNITPSPLVPGGYFVGDYMGVTPLARSGFGAVFVVARPGTTNATDVYYVAR